jgi:cytochrome P450
MFHAPEASEVVDRARTELPALVQGLGARTLLPDFASRLPIPVLRRFDAASNNLRAASLRLVTAYRKQHGDLGDFVSMLMQSRDARTGTAMSDIEIRDQVMTLLISGIETPATVLTWAFYELARNFGVRERLEAEVDEVLGGRRIGVADLSALRYTEAFVQECLRLHHPLWLLMRRAVQPVTLGGVNLAPGDEVIYSPAAMHRDPTIFTDPGEFRPERWLDGAATPEMQQAFIPFGLGNRQCVGDRFAWTQLKMTVAATVARYRLTPAAGHQPKSVVTSIVHLDRLPMVVSPRSTS